VSTITASAMFTFPVHVHVAAHEDRRGVLSAVLVGAGVDALTAEAGDAIAVDRRRALDDARVDRGERLRMW